MERIWNGEAGGNGQGEQLREAVAGSIELDAGRTGIVRSAASIYQARCRQTRSRVTVFTRASPEREPEYLRAVLSPGPHGHLMREDHRACIPKALKLHRYRLHDTTGDDPRPHRAPRPKRRAGRRFRRLDGGWMGAPCSEGR